MHAIRQLETGCLTVILSVQTLETSGAPGRRSCGRDRFPRGKELNLLFVFH